MIVSRAVPFRSFLLLFLLAVPMGGASPGAAADGVEAEPPLTGRQLRGALRDADSALAAGQLDRAGGLYRQVVASASGDDRHARALYGVALVEALTAPEARDAALAIRALEELASSFPAFDRAPEVAAVRGCLDELDRADGDAEHLTARIAELEGELAARTADRTAEYAAVIASADRVADLEAEGDELRAEVEELRAKLASTEAELARKEEALDQVKQTLVDD